jgi:hypothetical protein
LSGLSPNRFLQAKVYGDFRIPEEFGDIRRVHNRMRMQLRKYDWRNDKRALRTRRRQLAKNKGNRSLARPDR